MKSAARLSITLGFLAGIHLLVVFAGFGAPYSYDTQDRLHPFAPPTRVHFFDSQGKFHLRPFVYAVRSQDDNPTEYGQDYATTSPVTFFAVGEQYSLFGVWRCRRHLFGVSVPARIYLLGADGFGRDQFSRLLYGGRVSLFAG